MDEDSLSHELPNSVENFAPREVSTDFPAEAMPVNMRSFFKNEETGKEVDKKCQWLCIGYPKMESQSQLNVMVNTFAAILIPVEISTLVLLDNVELDFWELEIPEREWIILLGFTQKFLRDQKK